LAKDKPIVAYCRGPFCLYARDAVAWLSAEGFNASQWQDGVTESLYNDKP
jgi:rhodanese-related sulfurtransferase